MELLQAPKNFKHKDITLKVLSVVGGIAVVAGIVWVGVRGLTLFPNIGTLLANAVASVESIFIPAERIVVATVDSQIVVNEPFTLTWDHREKKDDGSYTLSYECRDNLFLARRANGTQTTLFCNTQIPILENEKEISLIAIGTVDGFTELPVAVAFKRNNQPIASLRGEATLLVQDTYLDTATSTDADILTPTSTSSTPSTSSPQPHTPTVTVPIVTPPFSNPNGKADLAVRVLGYGLVDKTTGVFTARTEIPQDIPSGKRAAIKFEIVNLGTKETGSWKFEAELPTSPAFTYTSNNQQSLFPGDKIQYTIGFDSVRDANQDDYTITADSTDKVTESNEKNNIVEGTVKIDR
jgi:hypothetical protein